MWLWFNKIFEGRKTYLGEKKENTIETLPSENIIISSKNMKFDLDHNKDKLDYGYCCSFILNVGLKVIKKEWDKDKFNEQSFKNKLNDFGNNIVYGRIENLIKVHIHVLVIHTQLLEYVTKFGELDKNEITNMTYQI